MKAGITLLLIAMAASACASAPPVQVVHSQPDACKFLGEVGHGLVQCGEGEPSEGLLQALNEATRALGGNPLQCCEVGTEVVVIDAYDRHGNFACTNFYPRTG